MPSTGSGTVTPVSGGAGTGLRIAEPLPYTLLSLPRYARLLGINPVHFQRATTTLATTVFPAGAACNDLWPRYSWQASDRVSHEDLAYAILSAEEEIARYAGFWPAPMWISDEPHQYPRPYRRDTFGSGLDIRGQYKTIQAKYGKFIQAGRRAVTLVGTATVAGGSLAYTDEDSDGLFETATVTLPTTLTDACEIKLYISGEGGAREWEIRPVRSKEIAGANIVFTLDSWLLIDPDLLAAYPTSDGFRAIDISTIANFVTSLDVYREYTDFTEPSAVFYWERRASALIPYICPACGGAGCAACELVTQDGCVHTRDIGLGLVAPVPATYDVAGAAWAEAAWADCREPDMVKIWYYAGDLAQQYLAGSSCEPLSDWFAQAIAWMATARLERPFCTCQNLTSLGNDLRTDLAFSDKTGGFQVTQNDLENPFGTRKGEIMAWRRLRKLEKDLIPSVAIV